MGNRGLQNATKSEKLKRGKMKIVPNHDKGCRGKALNVHTLLAINF